MKGEIKMEYPKKMMRFQELIKFGIPKVTLLEAYDTPGQTFARKISPLKKNSPIIFDTDGFEKWWQKRAKAAQRGQANG